MVVETDERAVTCLTLTSLAQAYKFALSGKAQTLNKERPGITPVSVRKLVEVIYCLIR
jgi:hypothetical protein